MPGSAVAGSVAATGGVDVLATQVAYAGVLDHDQLEDLCGLFGGDAYEKLLAKFRSDLLRRLEIVDRKACRADVIANAHAMISSAGSLGFTHFSNLCRAIERVGLDEGELAPAIAAFAAGGQNVLLTIATIAGAIKSGDVGLP